MQLPAHFADSRALRPGLYPSSFEQKKKTKCWLRSLIASAGHELSSSTASSSSTENAPEQYASLNDRLSCHDAHSMGEKQKKTEDAPEAGQSD